MNTSDNHTISQLPYKDPTFAHKSNLSSFSYPTVTFDLFVSTMYSVLQKLPSIPPDLELIIPFQPLQPCLLRRSRFNSV
jgi:hypothetical protein